MFALFLKKLATDTSAEAIGRIKLILEQNGISCKIITSEGKISVGSESHVYNKANPVIHDLAPRSTIIYYVYVKRKDYSRACVLISN